MIAVDSFRERGECFFALTAEAPEATVIRPAQMQEALRGIRRAAEG